MYTSTHTHTQRARIHEHVHDSCATHMHPCTHIHAHAVIMLHMSIVSAECNAKCTDFAGWKDASVHAWDCQTYIDSAQQGAAFNFCGSDGSGEACCFCGGGIGGEECANGCNDKDGWLDSNGWTCLDYVWSPVNYCGWEDSADACCYCKNAVQNTADNAPYCMDKDGWLDTQGSSCNDYQYIAEVDGKNECGWEDSATACCFCGGGDTCKPCGPSQFSEGCNDCRECSSLSACPSGQIRTACGSGSKGTCVAPPVSKNVETAVGSRIVASSIVGPATAVAVAVAAAALSL